MTSSVLQALQSFPPGTEQDRAAGLILGLAAGDRNGGPIRMACLLAESLNRHKSYQMIDAAEHYLAWWREGAKDTGPVFDQVMRLIDEGRPMDRAVAQVHRENGGKTAGCNPAHRIGPLAMAAYIPDERLTHFAGLETAISHWDPMAGEAAAVVATLCRLMIRGVPWQEAAQEAGFGRSFKVMMALETKTADPAHLKKGGYAPDVLQAAAGFLSTYSSFSEALGAAIEFAGPANYSPVLVGAIGGARAGASGIDLAQVSHIEPALADRILACSRPLIETWGR